MPIRVECGSCHKAFAAPDKYAGKTVKCPGCSSPISIASPDIVPSNSLASLLDDFIPDTASVSQPSPLTTLGSMQIGSPAATTKPRKSRPSKPMLGGLMRRPMAILVLLATVVNLGAFLWLGEPVSAVITAAIGLAIT